MKHILVESHYSHSNNEIMLILESIPVTVYKKNMSF
jgi:hypothetical protein